MATNDEQKIKELELLYRVSQILDENMDMRNVLRPVMDTLGEYMGFKHATVTLYNRQTGEISIELATGLSPMQTKKGRYKVGEGITGKVVESGKPIVVPDVTKDPNFLDRTGRGKVSGKAFICVPIIIEKEVVGALSVDEFNSSKDQLNEDLRLLEIIAMMIASAVKLRRQAEEETEILLAENERLRTELKDRFRPSNIIGNSREMQVVFDQISKVAKSPSTVLILGETGTGKELVAQAIHYNSDRVNGPFVRVHCAALPENIIESELFGHEKGAFTGAVSEHKGRFEMADGGTIFLDEIGEISPTLQVKLLRVLQEHEFERVGGNKTIHVNIRVIAATNKNLLQMVHEGKFREDLYYRLHIFPIYVPPLRKRKSDIVLLADYFLERYSKMLGKDVRRLSTGTIDMLMSYHWAGNVRELENCIERAVLVAEGNVIYPHHLPPTLQTAESTGAPVRGDLKSMVETYERDIICDALKSAKGKVAPAARALATTQRILGYKIKMLGINPKRFV
jgi:Nif-specific regulatory protein